MLPLLLSVLTIGLGSRLLAKEESEGTLELLLARPVSRAKLLAAKAMAGLVGPAEGQLHRVGLGGIGQVTQKNAVLAGLGHLDQGADGLIIHRAGFTPFFLFAAGLAVLALLMLGILPDTPRPKAEGAAGGVLRLLAQPQLTTALIATLVFGANMAAVFTFVPTFAQSVGIVRIGLFYLTYTTAAVLVRVFGGRLSDVAGRRRVILPGLLLLALGTLLLTGVASLTALALVGVLNGVAHGILYPALSAYIIDAVAPPDRGRAVGVFSASFLLGHMSGSFGFGFLVEKSGYPTMFTTAAGLTMVGLLLSLLAKEGRTEGPHESPGPESRWES
ncbi:MAG: MFS transporter [Deltaproteobacteria bacterium]|nr:MFS transporter [Deltaproteobacteria bacterium]